jgi:hypothetical protein
MSSNTESTNYFSKLAAINVNDKIEKKNGLSYLSWAFAVQKLLEIDPNANWEYGTPIMFGESMMIYCTVTTHGISRTCHLPVMDHRNKAIANPDAFQVNTAMQRCLVKAIALHGLGLYIYAGEDVPQGSDEVKGDVSDIAKLEAKHWATKMQEALDADVTEDVKAMKCFDVHVMIRMKSDVYIAAAEMLPSKMRSAWKTYIKMAEQIGNQSAALR